jgi:selenium metabolism protein YedF
MELVIDAMGDACPLPVVKAKQGLSTIDEGTVEVHVDNETATHNLENLAKSLKCTSRVDQVAEAEYHVFITKDADSKSGETLEVVACGTGGSKVVVISSQVMGQGDDMLGGNLMKAFIFSLTQMDTLPDTMLFYNGGAYLTCEGSPALDDVKALAAAGVEVLTCGTCLKRYGIEEKLAVGEVTNMYVIVEKQLQAGVVIRP